MRTRINNITFTPGTRSITTGITDLTIDDIRLFINESQMKVICSSMQKGNIDSISSGVVTYKDTFPVLAEGDHITFEIDKGDDVAKKSDIPTVQQIQNGLATESNATTNKEAIIAAIPTIPTDYAKDTSVKQGNDTAIGMLKDATNGLAAIKSAIPSVANIQNGLAPSTAVVDGNDTAIGVIKGLNSEVGTSSDTTSETGTLFGIVKWAKDKVKDIYTALTNHVTEVQTTHPYAKETSVKDGNNNTVIDVTKAIQTSLGTAPAGSSTDTVFEWLTTIYEYLVGQTPEEIPEGLGDRINLLLQFFGLPQALPEYQSMPLLEMTGILEDIMTTIDSDLTAEEAAAITEEVLSSDSSDDSSD